MEKQLHGSSRIVSSVASIRQALVGTPHSWLPSRGNMLFTLLVVSLVFLAQSVGAFSPAQSGPSTSLVPYQGRLANASGQPLTGPYAMSFRLYTTASGGIPLWTEEWRDGSSVQVSDGMFNVMLGSLSPIPQTAIVGQAALWLGVTVGTDQEMTPRVQLGTVPYAVQALTVPDGSIGTTKLANGAVGTAQLANGAVGTAQLANGAVSTAKIGNGAVGSAQLANGAVGGSQLAGTGFGASNGPLYNFVPIAPVTFVVLNNTGSRNWTTADLSSIIPAGAKAVLINGYTVDTNATTTYTEIRFDAAGLNQGVFAVVPQGRWSEINQGIVPVDSARRIAYKITASGTTTFSTGWKVIGYWEPAQR